MCSGAFEPTPAGYTLRVDSHQHTNPNQISSNIKRYEKGQVIIWPGVLKNAQQQLTIGMKSSWRNLPARIAKMV